MQRPLDGAAAVLIALALWFSYGTLHPWALALVTAGSVAALAAAIVAPVASASRAAGRSEAATLAALAVGVALGLGSLLLAIPGDLRAPPQHPYVVSLAAVALAIVLSYGLELRSRRIERARFPALLVVFAAMAAAALLHGTLPVVDVWMFRQGGAMALLGGRDPYELLFPNIYTHDRFYGPGVLQDGKVTVFPYPPLTLLVDTTAFLAFGDVRWAGVAATIAAAALIGRLGAGPRAELAAALVLFQPRTLYVAKVAWTEPLVLATWACALHAVRRWRGRAPSGWAVGGVGLGLLLAAKQYAPLLAAPVALAAPRAGRARAALVAAALVAATFVPFAIWNPGELWRDVAAAQVAQPFRSDALSWLAAWARWRGEKPSALVGFALAGAVLAFGVRRGGSLRRAAATAGSAFLVLVLFNKQAFCNYYWLAAGVLASAAALDDPRDEAAPLAEAS